MTRDYHPIDPKRLKTYSVAQRAHKASVQAAAKLPDVGAGAAALIDSFPHFLGAESLRRIVAAVAAAVRADRPVIAAFGAHVIKVGCGPILIDLIQRGILKGITCNGASAIHDAEIALLGETSEDVAARIHDGTFGMVQETLAFFDAVLAESKAGGIGLGEAVAVQLEKREAPHRDQSVFVAAHRAGLPMTVHVAVGTDTIHVSPGADGAALGEATMRDFRLLCDVVADLGARGGQEAGGVWLNIGSAVVLPEVFLKAVSVARNLGADLDAMTTANFDMIRHYRPHQNVTTRPVRPGHGHEVVGHHEILLPLFRQAVIEALAAQKS